MMVQLTVGKLAKASGIGVETVRYYEKRGLLPEPDRLPSGYRVYSGGTVNRIRFIKRAQELGFTLEEIQALLLLTDNPDADCEDVRNRAQNKITEIKTKMDDLQKVLDGLIELSGYCPGKGKPLSECSILKHFYGEKL